MTKIRILSSVCLGGGVDAAVGDEPDVSKALAIDLVEGMGVAEYVVDPPQRGEIEVVNRDPEPSNRDPKPANRDPKLGKG